MTVVAPLLNARPDFTGSLPGRAAELFRAPVNLLVGEHLEEVAGPRVGAQGKRPVVRAQPLRVEGGPLPLPRRHHSAGLERVVLANVGPPGAA